MIGFLRGKVVERSLEGLILEVNGVGYDVQCSLNTLDEVSSQSEVKLWVQTYIREDALSLFGFASTLEKKMFLSLVKVNGVGPKMALKILSATSITYLLEMIEAGDVKALSGLPKVGKKTAEQLILSLKGKLILDEESPADMKKVPKSAKARGDLISALVNLGFRLQDVEKVVADMPKDLELQQGIREGLQALTGQF